MSASKAYRRLEPYNTEHVHVIPLYDLKEHIPYPGREDFEDGTRVPS